MSRGSSALSCESCGHLNDLRNVQRVGLERMMRCDACAHVERWTIGSVDAAGSFAAVALAATSEPVVDRSVDV